MTAVGNAGGFTPNPTYEEVCSGLTGHVESVLASKAAYQKALTAKGYGAITTEIAEAGPFYFAVTYHQQYLAKNPHGYCGIGGTGVACAIGTGVGA